MQSRFEMNSIRNEMKPMKEEKKPINIEQLHGNFIHISFSLSLLFKVKNMDDLLMSLIIMIIINYLPTVAIYLP